MIRRLAIAIVAALSVAPALTGCAIFGTADPIPVTVPSDIATVQTTPIGTALKEYGYTPVTELFENKKPVGHVYVACGETADITECATDLHNRGMLTRPNVYVKNGKITMLEGPHTSPLDNRSFYVMVPAAYQDFPALTAEQKTTIVQNLMPEVVKNYGDTSEGGVIRTLNLSIGTVDAWVSRYYTEN